MGELHYLKNKLLNKYFINIYCLFVEMVLCTVAIYCAFICMVTVTTEIQLKILCFLDCMASPVVVECYNPPHVHLPFLKLYL